MSYPCNHEFGWALNKSNDKLYHSQQQHSLATLVTLKLSAHLHVH